MDRDRGQGSLTVLEAALGVLLLSALTLTFALGHPTPDREQTQLELYAEDALTVLAGETPSHADRTRLTELSSDSGFERERGAVRRRLARILPENVLFSLSTSGGSLGNRRPDDVPVGRATVQTTEGEVTLVVWYA